MQRQKAHKINVASGNQVKCWWEVNPAQSFSLYLIQGILPEFHFNQKSFASFLWLSNFRADYNGNHHQLHHFRKASSFNRSQNSTQWSVSSEWSVSSCQELGSTHVSRSWPWPTDGNLIELSACSYLYLALTSSYLFWSIRSQKLSQLMVKRSSNPQRFSLKSF